MDNSDKQIKAIHSSEVLLKLHKQNKEYNSIDIWHFLSSISLMHCPRECLRGLAEPDAEKIRLLFVKLLIDKMFAELRPFCDHCVHWVKLWPETRAGQPGYLLRTRRSVAFRCVIRDLITRLEAPPIDVTYEKIIALTKWIITVVGYTIALWSWLRKFQKLYEGVAIEAGLNV